MCFNKKSLGCESVVPGVLCVCVCVRRGGGGEHGCAHLPGCAMFMVPDDNRYAKNLGNLLRCLFHMVMNVSSWLLSILLHCGSDCFDPVFCGSSLQCGFTVFEMVLGYARWCWAVSPHEKLSWYPIHRFAHADTKQQNTPKHVNYIIPIYQTRNHIDNIDNPNMSQLLAPAPTWNCQAPPGISRHCLKTIRLQ